MLVKLLLSILIMSLGGVAGITIMWLLVKNDFFLRQFRRFFASERFKRVFSVKNMVAGFLICFGLSVLILIVPWQEAALAATPAVDQFSLVTMIKSMGAVAIAVVVILVIMSVYSLAIMVERYLTYSAAKKLSREFAPRVAQALKNDRIEEAIDISNKHPESPLATVISSGLQEFRTHEGSSDISSDEIEASKRALQRAIEIKSAEFKRGLSGLATIGSTAPFVGLFGTVFGIINAFRAMRDAGQAGIGAVASGISEALFTTALGLLVAVPAVWLFNYLTGKVDGFIVELDKSASELVNNFIRKHNVQLGQQDDV